MNFKEDFTERAGKTIDLYVLNTSVFINALKVGKPMAMNPIEESEANISLMPLFQEPLKEELGIEFAADLNKNPSILPNGRV